jgi:serpin B
MPRFRVESGFGLVPVLEQLGVHHAFDESADFSGMTEAEGLNISAVVHKAYVDVDEHGTEAAAATAMVMVAASLRISPPAAMLVDRPFLFAIIDSPTRMPLFLGQVSTPASR